MNSTQTWAPIAKQLIAADRERRGCRRVPWLTHVTVSVAGDRGCEGGTDDTTADDFSPSGISFIWRQSMEPGVLIDVCFELLPDQPELAAEVRHCTHIGGTFYHIGAEFTDNSEVA